MRTSFYVPRATLDQIDELASALHVTRISVISQAVARLHADEPLLRGNGEEKESKKWRR